MNILHVIQTLSANYGGPVTVVRSLAAAQSRQGHRVVVCAGKTGRRYLRPNEENGVEIRVHKAYLKSLFFSKELLWWLKSEIAKFDVVHIHGLYRFPVSFAAFYARKRGVPYVIAPHGSLNPFLYRQSRYGCAALPLKRIYERFIDFPNLNHASAIHFCTLEEAMNVSFLKLEAKRFIIPMGINWDEYEDLPSSGLFRKRLGIPCTTPLLLFLGRINFVKGLNFLARAFTQVLSQLPEARLAIVGPDDGYWKEFRELCRTQGLEGKVLRLGMLEADKVQEALVDADVMVLPSYAESFSMSVIESMACACPVIVSNKVGLWREIAESKCGIVVELDVDQIAAAICRILLNKEEARLMGSRGRKTAQEHYSWSTIAAKIIDHYAQMLKPSAA